MITTMVDALLYLVIGRYDSLDAEGKVKWQCRVTEVNKPFLQACDGIFLDYHVRS